MKKFFILIYLIIISLSIFLIFDFEDIISFQIRNQNCFGNNSWVIVIDPGHGGEDYGCTGKNGTYEKELALEISKELKKFLQENGYIVYMTREDDNFVDLIKRAEFANSLNADLFVSIHLNSAAVYGEYAEGYEIYYYDLSEANYRDDMSKIYSDDLLNSRIFKKKIRYKKIMVTESEKVAESIRKYVEDNNIKFRKIAQETFDVIAYTDMPSVLLECNFLSNPEIEESFESEVTVKLYSNIIFKGINGYFKNNE